MYIQCLASSSPDVRGGRSGVLRDANASYKRDGKHEARLHGTELVLESVHLLIRLLFPNFLHYVLRHRLVQRRK